MTREQIKQGLEIMERTFDLFDMMEKQLEGFEQGMSSSVLHLKELSDWCVSIYVLWLEILA